MYCTHKPPSLFQRISIRACKCKEKITQGRVSKMIIEITFGEWWVSLVVQMVKDLPALRETWVQSWGWEDPLEKGTHSSILAWKFHGLISPCSHRESDTTE